MAANMSVPVGQVRPAQGTTFQEELRSNPFESDLARANSSYAALRDGKLAHPLDRERDPAPLTEFIHDSFRALVLNPKFSCVGAKAAVQQETYRFGVYGTMATAEATAGLAYDLWTFVQEQTTLSSNFTTFVASFAGPIAATEREFEQQLWAQLQCLHDLDVHHHGWDPSVSADPDNDRFGYSFAGRAFFVIGLHPASSRWTRRFAWPTLIFNAHYQFEHLREQGKFTRMRDTIRTRERALQGDINAVLSDFGDRSEARQYAGRSVSNEWRCPFHAHAPRDAET